MGSVLIEKELEFNFTSAIKAIHFDKEDHKMSHCMKAVDFLVEWPDEFWFVEVKDPAETKIPKKYKKQELQNFLKKMKKEKLFSQELGPKLKDSFLYLHLSKKLPDKTLKYFVLLAIGTLDYALQATSIDHLKRYTCLLGPDNSEWPNQYIDAVAIFNEDTWNKKLNQCPVTRKN